MDFDRHISSVMSRDVPDVKFAGFRILDVAGCCLLDSRYRMQNSKKSIDQEDLVLA